MKLRILRTLGAAWAFCLCATISSAGGGPVVSNLTGTYTGSFTCKQTHTDGESDTFKTVNSVLRIAQVTTNNNGAFLDVAIDGVPYSARTIDIGGANSGKGVGAFVFCGGNDDAYSGNTEVEKFTFKVNAEKGTGTIKKNGLFNYTDGPPGSGSLGSCKGSWKRTSIDVPVIEVSCGAAL
jgi:hypothetical protein